MSASYKPDGYTSVAPYLTVDGASRTIAFLIEAMGAVPLRRFDAPDGRVLHAEVRIDDTVVMLTDGAEGWPAKPADVHLYVADVDETYQRAMRAGAVSVQEPVKKEDPDRRGAVRDPGGTTWWIATQVD